jgi:hypothetical protein
LWSLTDVTWVSSPYAIGEANRNLDAGDRRARLYRLIQQIEVVDEAPASVILPSRLTQIEKDQPILRAASITLTGNGEMLPG